MVVDYHLIKIMKGPWVELKEGQKVTVGTTYKVLWKDLEGTTAIYKIRWSILKHF